MSTDPHSIIQSLAKCFDEKGWEYDIQPKANRLTSGFDTNKSNYLGMWEYEEGKELLTLQLFYPDACTLADEFMLEELNRLNRLKYPGYFIINVPNKQVSWVLDTFITPSAAVAYQWEKGLYAGLAIMDHFYDNFQRNS